MNPVRQSRRVRSGHGILTAVLVGSTVFSALSLPLMMQKPVPVLMDFPPQWDQTPISRMDRETRNSVIRYLGIAIVASVGSGIGAVELLRRQYRSLQAESEAQEAAGLANRSLEPAYAPFAPASSEAPPFSEESAQSNTNSAASEELVSQSTAIDFRTGATPS